MRAGRKPLTTGHVNRLYGSPRAKDRMRAFLDTLRGAITVREGRKQLELSEGQFHHLRHKWLQESLELLEPRRLGRPSSGPSAAEAVAECERMREEIARLEAELRTARAREEIARIMSSGSEPEKKTASDESLPVKPR